MRTYLVVAAAIVFLGCGPDEWIPTWDATLIDSPPGSPDASAIDGSPTDANGTDASDTDASDTDAMPPTYTHDVDIQPVWSGNCSSPSCHPSMASGADAYGNLVGVPSTQVPSMALIQPGSPDTSYLWHKINNTHLGVGGMGEWMPPGNPLKATTLEMIQIWIAEGAPR